MFRSLPQTLRTTGHGLAIHLALLWVVGKPDEKSLDKVVFGKFVSILNKHICVVLNCNGLCQFVDWWIEFVVCFYYI